MTAGPERLVPVPAAELQECAFLAGRLARWLAETTPEEFAHDFFGVGPTRETVLDLLSRIADRVDRLAADEGRMR